MKKNYRSMFPALNDKCRRNPVATDSVFCDTPAIDDGYTCAQLFLNTKTLIADVYGMESDKQFVNSLEDRIRQRGDMNELVSDSPQPEISKSNSQRTE